MRMQFERSDLEARPSPARVARRVWDGYVRGNPDCWVVVARDERDLIDWFRCEDLATEAAPLRICRAILDDGVLVLEDSAPEDGEPYSDPI
jgi:hypothetical protein